MAKKKFLQQTGAGSDVEIIYEDNHLLLVNKPAGLLSQADISGRADLVSLAKAYLIKEYNKPGGAWLGLVHRLDQPVAGLIILAKTSKAAGRLSSQIREDRIDKYYLAVCHGLVEPSSACWEDQISRRKKAGKFFLQDQPKSTKDFQACSLSYRRLSYQPKEKLSLLEIKLLTGRRHQIRVQTSARGWPLVGDRLYGRTTALDKASPGPALFAYKLAFDHPISGDRMTFMIKPKQVIFDYFSRELVAL